MSSFPPVADPNARVLILGSMPGAASLAAQRYYAHPRNAFWPILAELCGFAPELAYPERLRELRRAGVALWDVLQSCARAGSLDSDIEPASIRVNDFARFFADHPAIAAVFCNGGTAYRLFERRVRPSLRPPHRDLPAAQLPSTSPAHARLDLAGKRELWREHLAPWL